MSTNITLDSGAVGLEDSTITDTMTIGDMKTNIGITALGYIAIEVDGTFDHYAKVGDFVTNLPLTAAGEMITTADAGEDEKIFIGDILSTLGKKNGKVKVTSGDSFNFYGPTSATGVTIVSTEPTPVLYTTLLSTAAITTPAIGPTGTITGTPTYDADGILIDADGKYVDYTFTYARQGAVRFTVRPQHDDTFAANACYLDNPTNTNKILVRFRTDIDGFQFFFGGSPNISVINPYSFTTNEELEMLGVWDETGIDGSGDKISFYINGVLQGADTGTLPTLTNTIIRIGNDWVKTCDARSKIKEFKIWDEVVLP